MLETEVVEHAAAAAAGDTLGALEREAVLGDSELELGLVEGVVVDTMEE